jgi:hypothetical protein
MKKISFTIILAFLAISLTAQIKITSPALVNPENNSDNQMPDAVLDWNAVSGIGELSYEAQLDEDASFPAPISFFTDLTSVEMENLLFGHEYFWRVRATDENGTSDWSEVFSFTLFDEIELKKPNNGADEQDLDAELKWKNRFGSDNYITGIMEFEYQVSLDDAFTNIYIASTVPAEIFEGEQFVVEPCSELFFNTTYYWRVRAKHALDVSEWSETRSFSTIVTTELNDPNDGELDVNLDPTLEWDEISGAFEYTYQIGTDPVFASFITGGIINTNEITLQPLMFGTTYYWRVNSLHTQDTSIWTDPFSFETINTVDLESPEAGDTVSVFPLLKWEEQTGIEKYELQYGTSESFVSPQIAYIDAPKSEYKVGFSLIEDMEYFWRVRAIGIGDTTNWSETWNFFTPSPIGINDNILQKENVQIYPNPSNGVLNVELNSTGTSMVRISVMDLLGQKVFENTLSFDRTAQIQMIDLNALENGLYILRLESGSSIYNQKFILDK